ncbi:uncharacterized protein I206_103011 [Kwoniella pini CBS 10737]|uniref:Chromo domain-containing protein n=1 Tax=Kwoniella pini CBS 10737 TaxID=1296096 RepID=A0A1B9IBD1_9TREE|nr:uncharacterized protein I206_01983 [Kwoniella pini CBS 10737]OCF52690.1 hypothetical protein I206_01983 [Kwoniella pini CBS 10737]
MVRTSERRAAALTKRNLSLVNHDNKISDKRDDRIHYPTPTSVDGDDLCSLNSEEEDEGEDALHSIQGDDHLEEDHGGLPTSEDVVMNELASVDTRKVDYVSLQQGHQELSQRSSTHSAVDPLKHSHELENVDIQHSHEEFPTPPSTSPSTKTQKNEGKSKKSPKSIATNFKDNSMEEKAILTPLILHGKAPVETTVNNHWVYLFFRFCAERHKMYERRTFENIPRDQLTKDETMSKMHIGNVFRQLDPSSKMIRDNILGKGDQSVKEVCFRLFLFCMFYNESTWKELCKVSTGGIPTWSNYISDLPKFEYVLYRISFIEKKKIYYGGFQLVPPTIYFTNNRNKDKLLPHFAASLRLVLSIMLTDLPKKLKNCEFANDASQILQTIPTFGGFLSWNIICFLNDYNNQFKWFYRNFATCGPGPRSYLGRIFTDNNGKSIINSISMEESGLIWLYENQWKYWLRINENPPHAWELGLKPGLRVLDIENSLCWCHRYINNKKGGKNLSQLPKPKFNLKKSNNSFEPAWCIEKKWLNNSSKIIYKDDLEEKLKELNHIEEDENVFEVEKIICRKSGNRLEKLKDPEFRVRWKGYSPEADTYEKASTIKDGAEESLQEWLDWEKSVWDSIEKVKKDYPYTPPIIAKSEEEEIKPKIEEKEGLSHRPTKRIRRSIKRESFDL